MRSLQAEACATLLALTLCGQQVGRNVAPGAGGTATFQTGTQLVIETVVVKDKAGKAVEGLTAKDFTVTEDGVPQARRLRSVR